MGFLRCCLRAPMEASGSRPRRRVSDLPVKMWSEWMSASNSPRKVDKLMRLSRNSSQKCGQNGWQPQILLVKWTKKRDSCEKPRVFSVKVAQTMDFQAWGGQRQPGGAKWRRLGADVRVKMWSEWMSASNMPQIPLVKWIN